MADLSTTYLGLKLKSPLIVGSSGLTSHVKAIIEHEKNGAGAVVLKSLFEEQIKLEAEKVLHIKSAHNLYAEAQDYIMNYTRSQNVDSYLKLIEEAKKAVKIPVIASINCVSADEWPAFARKIEEAGADALELNVFILPSDFTRDSEDNERVYFRVIDNVKKNVSLPVALKVSYYFTNLARFIQRLSFTGIQGLVLFNRFFSPDIDLKHRKIIPANVFSSPQEISIPLRWISILAKRVKCDLAASTGVHSAEAAVKLLLAGAQSVQVVSALYLKGNEFLKTLTKGLMDWMDANGYRKIEDFRGQMCQENSEDPAAYERVQFMKHFSGIE